MILLNRMVRIAAKEAIVIFTIVLPTTMVMSNCLGQVIILLTLCSALIGEFLYFSNTAEVSEKYAVSEPEKNAEKIKRTIKLKK